MEDAIYQQLVADDPEAALEAARKGEVPLVKVGQLAQVGMKVLQKDPEQAFALAGEMLAAGDGKLGYETKVEYGNGSTSWGSGNGKGMELVDALFTKDPGRTLELVQMKDRDSVPQVFSNLVGRWSEEDVVGLSKWVNRQTEPKVRDPAAAHVVQQLMQRGEYAEALEWAGSTSQIYRAGLTSNSIHEWASKDPVAAEEWLEDSSLPEQEKQGIRQQFEMIKNHESNSR